MFFNILNYFLLRISYFVILISSSLLIAAYYFEYFEGLKPCQMCLWQRWVHFLIIFSCFLSMILDNLKRLFLIFSILFASISFIIAFWHSGVELSIFSGPNTCLDTLNNQPNISLMEFLDKPFVSCSEILWTFAGLSMANWNVIISLFLGLIMLISIILKGKLNG